MAPVGVLQGKIVVAGGIDFVVGDLSPDTDAGEHAARCPAGSFTSSLTSVTAENMAFHGFLYSFSSCGRSSTAPHDAALPGQCRHVQQSRTAMPAAHPPRSRQNRFRRRAAQHPRRQQRRRLVRQGGEAAAQPVIPNQRMGMNQIHAEGQRRKRPDSPRPSAGRIRRREKHSNSEIRRQKNGGRRIRQKQHPVTNRAPPAPSIADPPPILRRQVAAAQPQGTPTPSGRNVGTSAFHSHRFRQPPSRYKTDSHSKLYPFSVGKHVLLAQRGQDGKNQSPCVSVSTLPLSAWRGERSSWLKNGISKHMPKYAVTYQYCRNSTGKHARSTRFTVDAARHQSRQIPP